MRFFILITILCLSSLLRGQQLPQLVFGNKNQQEIIAINLETANVKLPKPLPVFSFEVNKLQYSSSDAALNKTVKIKTVVDNSFRDAVKWIISLNNISGKPIRISNIVPFGRSNAEVYISGKALADTSRSFLFQKSKTPVGVIVPHNNNDLNFSVVPLQENISLYALVRRNNDSIQNYLLLRTPYILQPGQTIIFYFYFDIANGDWHAALKKCFQQKLLYEVPDFNNSLYKRDDLSYIRNAYTMHLMMAWNKDYYDAADNSYHFASFLEKMKSLYGGDDVFAIWPTWPVLGLDQRSQWQLMEALPGGLPQQKKLAAIAHGLGTKYFISYNPWDDADEKTSLQQMCGMISNIDADGVVLDTKAEASKASQNAADKAKPGVILYSEGMAVPRDMQGIISGRVHNDIYYPPLLNLNKLIKPDFAIFRVAEINKESIRREYASALFNGYGVEINVMRPGKPEWVDDECRFWGRCVRILKDNSANFHSDSLDLLISTLQDSIYVNKWPSFDKTIYTVFSLRPQGFSGALFKAAEKPGYHFIDLWNHELVQTQQLNRTNYVPVQLDPFDKKYLGTNNEGAVTAIAEFPELIQTKMDGDKLSVSSAKGNIIKLWQGNPSYEKKSLQIFAHDTSFHLFQVFGRTEGKYVMQLFDNTNLLDEKIIDITPGTPLLVSEKLPAKMALTQADGMIKIPAGRFTMNVTNGDEFISYPKQDFPKQVKLKSFYVDVSPVTNQQFKMFVDAAQYHPADTTNFLKHWPNGNIPNGEENFPVIYVSYEDAQAYAAWAGKRLPTEAEWQYAAQTSDGRNWPWGNTVKQNGSQQKNISTTLTLVDYGLPDSTLCNTGDGKLYPVGKYAKGANPYGVQDLVGSVWQLTNDHYQSDTYDYIIMKGGSYYKPGASWWYVQGGPKPLQYRQMLLRVSPGFERNNAVGFRCVKDAE